MAGDICETQEKATPILKSYFPDTCLNECAKGRVAVSACISLHFLCHLASSRCLFTRPINLIRKIAQPHAGNRNPATGDKKLKIQTWNTQKPGLRLRLHVFLLGDVRSVLNESFCPEAILVEDGDDGILQMAVIVEVN
jgi:hypothetical protein